MNKNNNIYKVYQMMEFFTNKYSFNNVLVKEYIKPNEIWLARANNKSYNIIRLSITSLDETFSNRERIENYINIIEKTMKIKAKFLDVHISKELASVNEIFETVCIDSDFYSGKEVDDIFPLIKNVIHEVTNPENEIQSRISSINNNLRTRFKQKKEVIKQKFNITASKIIIAICCINFLCFAYLQSKYSIGASYIALGADYKMFTLGLNEFWRLFTYAFVHSSLIHLLCNCYSLFFLGEYIENKYGTIKFLIIFITSTIFGSLTHGIFTDNQITIGMSGGIYGLFIIYIIDAIKMGAWQNRMFTGMVMINLLMNFTSNVAWQTHLGGAIAGILYYFMFIDKKIDIKMVVLILIVFTSLNYKYFTIDEINPKYLGTDNEVINLYDDFGLHSYADNLANKLYNYYMNH